jgi:hypothetical protein
MKPPKSSALQPQGGRGKKSTNPKQRVSFSLSRSTIDAIGALPQISSGEWSESYLIDQLLQSALGLPSAYDASDLELILRGHVVE